MSTGQELIGTAAAAAALGVSPRTVHRMVEAGKLTPTITAPGGAYLFDPAHITAHQKESQP